MGRRIHMQGLKVFNKAFLDGFTFAGLFTRLSRPGAANLLLEPYARPEATSQRLVPDAPAYDDASLLARVKRGDEQAMLLLFERYSKIVYSVALRVLRDPESAEGILQEIFMQVWRDPECFVAIRGSLGGWLAVVSRNRSIDQLRRHRPTDSVEDVVLASSYNLADEAERNAMLEKARVVIQQLPKEQRKTVEMAFFDGLTHSESAEMSGDPLGSFKAKLGKASEWRPIHGHS